LGRVSLPNGCSGLLECARRDGILAPLMAHCMNTSDIDSQQTSDVVSRAHRPRGRLAAADAGMGRTEQLLWWTVLVAVAVVGRLWQPAWNVTPMAGVALAAGALFPQRWMSASVPLAALLISNSVLPGYGSWAMAGVVFAASIWPIVLGGMVRRGGVFTVIGGALASSLVFYLSTNLAHWGLTADYPHSLEGLVACYVAALPFYRWMPVGDLLWSVGLCSLATGMAGAMANVGARAAAE